MKIFAGKIYNQGGREAVSKEPTLPELKFKVYKFNNRLRPSDKRRIAIFTQFSEFGSELVAVLYCIPHLLKSRHLGKYSIAMGWYGRDYLYRHIVDEFWELGPEGQSLREYCRAFHHDSRNLRRLEREVSGNFGQLVTANDIGVVALKNIYPNIATVKHDAAWPIPPSEAKRKQIEPYLKPNMVGITARNRKCYGRNLQLDFYKKLIDILENKGYSVIWTGEEATTYDCPYSHIVDYRKTPEARDLECGLALTQNLKFTVQFYTASTRLAGLTGTPFILFESPDQIWGVGQEGIRLNLCSRGPKKIIAAHFRTIYNDNQYGLNLFKDALAELEEGNYQEIVCGKDNPGFVNLLKKENSGRIGSV